MAHARAPEADRLLSKNSCLPSCAEALRTRALGLVFVLEGFGVGVALALAPAGGGSASGSALVIASAGELRVVPHASRSEQAPSNAEVTVREAFMNRAARCVLRFGELRVPEPRRR